MALDDIKYYVIGIIMFTLVIGGGVYVTGSFFGADSSIDSVGEVSRFNSSLYRASAVTASVDALDDSLDVDEGVDNWLNVLLGSAFNGLKVVGESLNFMSVVANDAGNLFGVPSWIVSLLSLIGTIIVVIAIIAVVTRQ